VLLAAWLTLLGSGGCTTGPRYIAESDRKVIDRKFVETPRGYVIKVLADGLSAPTAIAFVTDEGEYKGAMLVAESGDGMDSPRIYGWKNDSSHSFFSVYPRGTQVPLFARLLPRPYDIYGPIGGMTVAEGRIYVMHHDHNGQGVMTAFTFDGVAETIVAGLPAQGDYGVTDVARDNQTGHLFFGVGSATNSGVVGLDNWQVGWVKQHPDFCDRPWPPGNWMLLQGFKYFTKNPIAGLFSGEDNVGTAPFQPFGKNDRLRINKAINDKPTSAIYWCSPSGGDVHVFAHGIRNPRGLAFDEVGALFATNDGMELRGSRPVKDDRDALLWVRPKQWYGFPDFSADLLPIGNDRFMERDMLIRTGYPELSALINHAASDMQSPTEQRETLAPVSFPSQSGAAKLAIVPATAQLRQYRGKAIVALSGDRAPFATGGKALNGPVGYKVVLANIDEKRYDEFVRNTQGVPAHLLEQSFGHTVEALERPIDPKVGPDGKLYILDLGRMEMHGGRERPSGRTGRIFVVELGSPTTAPTSQAP
jgi:glucose/arabinose dehydrogenase